MIDTGETGRRCYTAIRTLYKTEIAASKALGVTVQAANNWKRGVKMPSIDNIVRIADMTGISLDDLIVRG